MISSKIMSVVVKLSLTLFFIGIILLFLSYSLQQPISLSKIRDYIGETVIVEGDVIEISKTRSGKPKILIKDGNYTAYVILFFNYSEEWDRIRVKGTVNEFRNKIYIFVYNEYDLKGVIK